MHDYFFLSQNFYFFWKTISKRFSWFFKARKTRFLNACYVSRNVWFISQGAVVFQVKVKNEWTTYITFAVNTDWRRAEYTLVQFTIVNSFGEISFFFLFFSSFLVFSALFPSLFSSLIFRRCTYTIAPSFANNLSCRVECFSALT